MRIQILMLPLLFFLRVVGFGHQMQAPGYALVVDNTTDQSNRILHDRLLPKVGRRSAKSLDLLQATNGALHNGTVLCEDLRQRSNAQQWT